MQRIIDDVRREGDAAVRRYCEAFDGVPHDPSRSAARARSRPRSSAIEPELREALEFAADACATYHEGQLRRVLASYVEDGLGVQVRAIETVGFYAPGTAPAYPSSVLHTVVPAKVAGVDNVVLVSPAGPDGKLPAVKLAAAAIAGADRVFCCQRRPGGRGAGLRHRDHPARRQDFGPGSIFVTLAKRAVFGDVGIDSIYGPTETVIVADDDADPALCAVDLIAQAEHDELAAPVFITDSLALAERVVAEVEDAPRGAAARRDSARGLRRIAAASWWRRASRRRSALASEYAPEHLCILSKDARRLGGAGQERAAASSSATARPRRSATTPPARATSCRPAAPRASPRR